MRRRKVLGIVLIITSLLFGIGYRFGVQKQTVENITVLHGLIGSEKQGFFENTYVQKILKERYRLKIDYTKAGSIEMVKGDIEQIDFLFPSSDTAIDVFRKNHPTRPVGITPIFNSLIVLFSWKSVTEALKNQEIVEKRGDTYYLPHMKKLLSHVLQGDTWKALGLDTLHGSLTIHTTDPVKSNSGFLFAALLFNLLQSEDTLDQNQFGKHMEIIKHFFANIGYMERSSGYLFEQFLATGVGNLPLIVGYENQIIEYCMQDKEHCPFLREHIDILYPMPTVKSTHTLITLTPQSQKLTRALQDPDILKIAWEENGFRFGNFHQPISMLPGIISQAQESMSMPEADIMEHLLQILSHP